MNYVCVTRSIKWPAENVLLEIKKIRAVPTLGYSASWLLVVLTFSLNSILYVYVHACFFFEKVHA